MKIAQVTGIPHLCTSASETAPARVCVFEKTTNDDDVDLQVAQLFYLTDSSSSSNDDDIPRLPCGIQVSCSPLNLHINKRARPCI